MRKSIALLLTLCLLLCLCTGCADQSSPGGSSGTESSKQSSKSSAPDAAADAGETDAPDALDAPEGPAEAPQKEPADQEARSLPGGSDGAVWWADLRELLGKPMSMSTLVFASDGLIYTALNEFDMEDKNEPYFVSCDLATGTVSQPLWQARRIDSFAALENGGLGVLAQTEGERHLLRLSTDGEVLFRSPAIPESGVDAVVAPGYDAYCYCDPETGDLLLCPSANGETTLIHAGDGQGRRDAFPLYLSSGGRYTVYLKFQDGLLDSDTAWVYDAESGQETSYPLPADEAAPRSSTATTGVGDTIYFFENDTWTESFADRCWRIRDGGGLEELTLPFRYYIGTRFIRVSGGIVVTDQGYAEDTQVYLLDEDGNSYLADYRIPPSHWLAGAAVSGDRMALSIYEGGRSAEDPVYYLIETRFSRIG